jgi:hypothetical protein
VQGYLDEKDDLEREALEKSERKQRARERKRQGLKPEEDESAKDKKAEKAYNWHFVHISVFFDNDSRQLILTHDGTTPPSSSIVLYEESCDFVSQH